MGVDTISFAGAMFQDHEAILVSRDIDIGLVTDILPLVGVQGLGDHLSIGVPALEYSL